MNAVSVFRPLTWGTKFTVAANVVWPRVAINDSRHHKI